jgi:hypothetical protein
VLFLHWSVADIFFWFWCEFILAGITSFVLLMFWRRVEKNPDPGIAKIAPYLFVFSSGFPLRVGYPEACFV